MSSGVGTASLALSAQAVSPFGAGAGSITVNAAATGAWLHAGTGTAAIALTATAVSNNIFPLTVDASGRFLRQADGSPFLLCGDSTWEIAVNLSAADQATFLNDCVSRGINAVMANAIEHHYSVVKAPKDIDGNLPFTQTMNGATYTGAPNGTTTASGTQGQFAADAYGNINNQAPDPTFFNATYWARIDAFISACMQRNIAVFLWPMYLGFHGNQEGWISELTVWNAVTGAGGLTGQPFADPTKSKLFNYGAALAARWAIYPNIVWVAGGDYGSGSQSLNGTQVAAVKACIDGIKSVAGAQSTLWTAHWDRPCISDDTAITGVTWDLNFAYSGDDAAEVPRRAYAVGATKPAYWGEGFYEAGLFGGTAPFRKYLYWGFLGGLSGGFFGHEQLWRFDDGSPGTLWSTILATQGRLDAARQFAFFKGVAWHRLKPSGLGGMGTLVTVGGGTASPQSTTYVAAACTSEGDLLLAYVPPAHSGSITIDMTKMSAAARARWFDPTNATFTSIGVFLNTGTQAFTPPAANSAGDGDFLLVLETSAGTAALVLDSTAGGAAIVAQAGTASLALSSQAVGQSIAQAAGTASLSMAATGVSGTVTQGVGAGSLSLTAAAVGARIVAAAGAGAALTVTAAAAGAATATTTGQASLSLQAAGVGNSTSAGDASGEASLSMAAAGVGSAIAAAAGTASISLGAAAVSTVQETVEVEPGSFAALVAEMDDLIIEHLG